MIEIVAIIRKRCRCRDDERRTNLSVAGSFKKRK